MAWRERLIITLYFRISLVVLLFLTAGVRPCPPACTCTKKAPPGTVSPLGTGEESGAEDTDPSGALAGLGPSSVPRRGRRVDCSEKTAPFTALSQIEPNSLPLDTVQLDLSNNALTILPSGGFNDLSLLRKLDLSNNDISLIESEAFQGLENLERLDLSGNNIGSINATMFLGMPKLERLSLSKNRINTIPEGTFKELPQLKKLDFQSDYLRCDCHLKWMVKWMKDSEVTVKRSTVCALPRDVSGKLLKSLKKKDLHCEHELELPLFEVSPSRSQVVFEGDKLPFACRATVIDDATKMAWLREGKEVVTNRTRGIFVHTSHTVDNTIMIHSLVLESLEQRHNGIWQCRVSTPQGNVTDSVTITVISDTATSCPEVTVRSNKGVYVWQRTVAGIQMQQPCKIGSPRALATYYCNNLGRWEDLNVHNCKYTSEMTRKLKDFTELELDTEGAITSYAKDFKIFLSGPQLIKDAMDVIFAAQCISRIGPFVRQNSELSDILLDSVSILMKVDASLLLKAQQEDQACTRLVNTVDSVAEQLLSSSSSQHTYSENIAMETRKIPVNMFSGIVCMSGIKGDKSVPVEHSLDLLTCIESVNETLFTRAAAEMEVDEEESEYSMLSPSNWTLLDEGVEAAIMLPKTLFLNSPVLEGVSMGEVGVSIILYKNAGLFPITAPSHTDPTLAGGRWKPVSPVISASIGQSVANLTEPVVGMLEVTDTSRILVAAYWDFQAHGGLGDWRTDGCKITHQQGNVSVFNCNHLTNFVILQNLSSGLVSIFLMMEPIIYAGSCLLVICLMAVIVTYVTCFKFIRIPKKAKHSVINISIGILMLCIAFTMGVNRTDQERACQIVGIAIHYFTLCIIFWITITSSNMLKKFTKAEEPPAPPPEPIPMPLPPKPMLRFYLLGWGVPIIICGITAAVNMDHYSEREYCFLSWDPSLGAFYGPVSLLVVINLAFFMRISYVIRGTPNNLNYSDEMEELHTNEIELTPNQEFTNMETASLTHTNATNATSMSSVLDTEHRPISQLRALVATLFLYIVVWVCGAFAVARPFRTIIPRQEIIFSYLYGFTCLLLGGFMLAYYCLMRQDSRSSWKRFFSCEQQTVYDCTSDMANHMTHANGHVAHTASSVESSSLTVKVVNIHKEQKQQQQQQQQQQHQQHQQQLTKNGPKKQSNINLVPSQTASLTEVSFSSIGQDQSFPSFYNPRQNGVAKKFWEKRHNQSHKKLNKDLSKEITCSGSYDSNLDNLLNETASKRHSQCTSSDANTHFSIEIQIQANPRSSGGNHGRQPTSQDERPPSYDSLRKNKQLPMNIQATHQSAFHAVVPYERNQLSPAGGASSAAGEARTPAALCSSQCHYSRDGSTHPIPGHHCPTCVTSMGIPSQNACNCGKFAVVQMSPSRSMASSPTSEMLQRNMNMPRPRDFDGQSQVSQETPVPNSINSSVPCIQRLHPHNLVDMAQKHFPMLDKDCCTECLNNVQSDNNKQLDNRRMSDSSKHYRTSSDCYSSDSNVRRRRQKNFLQELERRIPPGHHVSSPSPSDITQSTVSNHNRNMRNMSHNLHHDSDSQLQYSHSRSHDFSDHNSEPSYRKRHHLHDSRRNRNRRHSKQSYGSGKQTSSEWEDHFKGRPRKIPYAYVNHRYKDRVRQKLFSKSGDNGRVPVAAVPETKVYWFPRSTSAYDQILPGGMEAMAEDTSSSSDDDSIDDIWVLQKERRERLKKETSV